MCTSRFDLKLNKIISVLYRSGYKVFFWNTRTKTKIVCNESRETNGIRAINFYGVFYRVQWVRVQSIMFVSIFFHSLAERAKIENQNALSKLCLLHTVFKQYAQTASVMLEIEWNLLTKRRARKKRQIRV